MEESSNIDLNIPQYDNNEENSLPSIYLVLLAVCLLITILTLFTVIKGCILRHFKNRNRQRHAFFRDSVV